MEMMLAVISMIGGGVLERHPNLRVAFLEGNCWWVPFLLWDSTNTTVTHEVISELRSTTCGGGDSAGSR